MTDNKQYPPLPDFEEVEQHIYGASRRYIPKDMLEPIHELMRAYVDADRAMRAARDAEDAARCRWLAAYCRSTAEHWGGRWSIIVEGPPPKSHTSEDDFYAAIDAARAAKEREQWLRQ